MGRHRKEGSTADPNKVSTSFLMDRRLHKRVKVATIFTEQNMAELIEEAVRRHINRLEKQVKQGMNKKDFSFDMGPKIEETE